MGRYSYSAGSTVDARLPRAGRGPARRGERVVRRAASAGASRAGRRARVRRDRRAAGAAACAAVYLVSYIGLVVAAQPVYRHRFFLSVGPFGIQPDGWPSFFIACVVVAASLAVGLAHLAGECGGVHDAILAASLASSAATGTYLACYTLLNPAVLAAFLAGGGAIAVRMAVRRELGLFAGLVRPLWLLLAALGFVTCAAWSWATSAAGLEVEYPEDPGSRRLAEHIDTAALFFDEGAWSGMSLGEKADALGEMVIVECNYLGIGEPPSIRVAPCPGAVVANYDDAENLITFNSSYLAARGSGKVAIEAAAHECAHRYQAECVRRGHALPTSESGWAAVPPTDETVARWADEFENYTPASEDLHGYLEQDCERSAEAYGMRSLLEIEQRVEKYRRTGDAGA